MKKMWAWYDIKKDEYRFIYPSELVVRICSPDGFKSKEERGEGKVIEVTISPLTTNAADGNDSGRCPMCGAFTWPDGKEFDYTP